MRGQAVRGSVPRTDVPGGQTMISKLQALLIAAVALTAAGALILMDTDGY